MSAQFKLTAAREAIEVAFPGAPVALDAPIHEGLSLWTVALAYGERRVITYSHRAHRIISDNQAF